MSAVTPGRAPGSSAVHLDGGRRRNPRGQGHRLRGEAIQAALALLADSGDPRDLSLRAVAARVGIAAPSLYRHFPDLEHLKIAVVEAGFSMLADARAAAINEVSDPGDALLAGACCYCSFALENPGLYRLMFGPDSALPAALTFDSERSPGRAAFLSLVQHVTDCQATGEARSAEDPFTLAVTIWALEHGLATLRLSRPHFPWPPIEEVLASALRQLLEAPTPGLEG